MAEATSTTRCAPRGGKGKKDGSLHEVTALALASQTLEAIAERNRLDTDLVGDVILGCVDHPWASRAATSRARPP